MNHLLEGLKKLLLWSFYFFFY